MNNMAAKMKKYIEEQPHVWQNALSALTEPVCRVATQLKDFQNIVMVGSGSSYYAACAASRLLQKDCAGIRFFTAVPTSMEAFRIPDADTVYIMISQSGKSTSTEKAAKQLLSQGAALYTVTSDAASPLAALGQEHILIPCGEESVGPKTKGMSTTLLTLWLLGQALICHSEKQSVDTKASQLIPAFQNAGENISASYDFAYRHQACLGAIPSISVIADSTALPLAQEGALKLLETLYVPAYAWEFEEYLHGVQNSMTKESIYIFVLESGSNLVRMNNLISYCTEQGCTCLTINCTSQASSASNTLNLHCTGLYESLGYELLLPFQILSAVVSEYKNIDCDKPRFPDFYAALGTKIQEKGISS